jgi:hypothetical protein
MEILIETATSNEAKRWGSNPGKVPIPGTTDVVFCGDVRPVDIGPDHFLATATVSEPALGPDQKRGAETVDVVGQAVTVNRPAVDMTQDELNARDRRVTFDSFEGRFTTAEWDAATDYVYEVNTTTGKPKRKALVQGLARAQAQNMVDLLDAKTDAFLGLLVTGGVITAARKIIILTP